MPKQSLMKGRTKVGHVTHKFRIGFRKTGRPAHEMTEADLRAKLGTRYHNKVVHVLLARGLAV